MPEPKPHPRTNRGEREFDTSSLREGGAGHYVARDYAAHWFRWQHAVRFIRNGMRVLDVGCGPDQMMPRVLCHYPNCAPDLYVGVDVGKIPKPLKIAWTRILPEFDVTRRWRELFKATGSHEWGVDLGFDFISCFEVIEHMPVERGRALLKALYQLVKPQGIVLLSTPVYNGKHMAANHIHEYGYEELKHAIAKTGFIIKDVVGTFMSAQAVKRVATPEQRKLVEQLHERWYAWDVLANFLAPLYPDASSNCCWILTKE